MNVLEPVLLTPREEESGACGLSEVFESSKLSWKLETIVVYYL